MAYLDVSIEYITLSIDTYIDNKKQTINILQSFNMLKLFEGIDKKFLSGSLEITDEYGLFKKVQFYTGKSYINFKFKDLYTENDYTFKFLIDTIPDIRKIKDKQIMSIHFVEENAILFGNEYCSYLDNQTISDYVSNYSKNVLLKELKFVENTNEKFTATIPYLKFHFILKYLNWYNKSKTDKNVLYTYFTNSLQEVFYTSYSYLMKQDAELSLMEVPAKDKHLNINYFADNGYGVTENWNTISTQLENGFGGTNIQFNHDTKEPIITKYKYSDVVKNISNMGGYSMYPKEMDNSNRYYYSTSDNYKFDMIINQENLDSSTLYSIPLEGAWGRTCGKTIDIQFQDPIDFELEFNPNKTGKHLIKNITHYFFKGAFKQELIVMKNAQQENNNLIKI